MTEVFIESMLCEQSQLLESFNVEIEEAKFALLESIDPSPFFEAGSEEGQKSGGIFQAILRVLQAIIKAIGDGFKKLGNWLTGAKVTPEGQTAKIQGMDPNVVVKLVDGDIADASDALRKAANGQMTIEDAKAFIDKKESAWNTLKSSAIPVVGLAAFFLGKKFTVDKWISEANAAKDKVEQLNRADNPNSDSKLASKVAHQFGDGAKRAAAKDASQLIVNHMSSTTKRGLDLIMAPIREAFQKNYLSRQIMNDAKLMGTRQGRHELNARDRLKRKAVNAERRETKRYGRSVDISSIEGNINIGRQSWAERRRDKARNKVYDNIE